MMESKRLTRSFKGVIAGVCGGLAKYFDLDPVLVRVIFLLLFFVGGGGVLLYIILWIAVPRETNYYTPYQQENIHYQKENHQQENPAGNPNAVFENNKKSGSNSTALILGIGFILFGIMLQIHKLFHIGFAHLWPVCLIIVGLLLIFVYVNNNQKIKL